MYLKPMATYLTETVCAYYHASLDESCYNKWWNIIYLDYLLLITIDNKNLLLMGWVH